MHATTAEGLRELKPVHEGGVVTYGSQTHPADGTAGAFVAGDATARALAGGDGVVRLLAAGVRARRESAHAEGGRRPPRSTPCAIAGRRRSPT